MSHQENISQQGKQVIEALSPLVKWKYDEFHKVMLAEFSVDKQDQVMFALKQVLPVCWDAKTIKKASPQIKHYAGSFAKLTKSQQLLAESEHERPNIMVAWWPWGHGATVSVRVFLTNSAPYQEKRGLFTRFTRLFS
jgi:hypothetical protein